MAKHVALWGWLVVLVFGWGVGFAALRMTVAAPEVCGPFNPQIAQASINGATGWFSEALLPSGRYVYEYNYEDDTLSDDYNLVRHAGVTMSLYQVLASGDTSVLETADAGMAYMLDNLVEAGDGLAFTVGGEQPKLGAAALMLAGLTLRREATGDDQWDEEMQGLARFMVAMQRDDGSMLNFWDPEEDAPVPGITSKYATGEAFWALAMMHEIFPEDGWDEPTRRISLYLATRRDEVEDFPFPPWADQWAAYGLSEIVDWGLSDAEVNYARRLAERFGFLIRVESRRIEDDPLKPINGQLTRGAGMGTWVEALTSLWAVAGAEPRLADLQQDIAERAVCGAGILAERQYSAEEAAAYPRPELVEGSWFRDGITRMDDTQHAVSGIVLTVPVYEWLEEQD